MPFGIIGRTGPMMTQVVGSGDRSTGRGTFGDTFGARHCNQWGIYGVGVRQCLNRRSCRLAWCVRGPRHCCITWGPHRVRGRKGFGGCSPFSQREIPLGRRCEMFPIRIRKRNNISVRHVVGKLDSWAFWRYIREFKINVGVYVKLTKSNDSPTITQMHAVKCCCPWCADSRCRRRRAACIFMNDSMNATAHCYCWYAGYSPPQ